jgi:hypothetical protein
VVKAGNVLFNADSRIQIADFSRIRLERGEMEPFSDEKWTRTAAIWAFGSLLVEIAVGCAAIPPIGAAGALAVPVGVPEFVSQMIEDGRSRESQCRLSFVDIVERLKENRFAFVADVDSDAVSAFVARVESAQQSGHWEETQQLQIPTSHTPSRKVRAKARTRDGVDAGVHGTDQQNETSRRSGKDSQFCIDGSLDLLATQRMWRCDVSAKLVRQSIRNGIGNQSQNQKEQSSVRSSFVSWRPENFR